MRSTLQLKKSARIVSSTDPYQFPKFMKIQGAIAKRTEILMETFGGCRHHLLSIM